MRDPAQLDATRARAFADLLREARLAAGYASAEAFAIAIGVSVRHYQRLESGAGNPRLSTLFLIADAVKQPVGSLVPD